jgi:2-keto-3-deoxy-L-arabinonate dehydratase
MQTVSGFYGVYPVAFALFGADGALDRAAVRRQVQAMVRHGVHGITVLGLASEVHRLSAAERRSLMEWVIEDAAGRIPVAVTVAEPSVGAQVAFAAEAKAAGAAWLILQPPPVKAVPEDTLIRFFGAVAERAHLPLSIQNAPEYLGVGLSAKGIATLNRAHPNISMVKVEATAAGVHRLFTESEGRMDIFNCRAGNDMVESLRAGAVGFVPGGESYDVLTAIFIDLTSDQGDPARGEARYREILPLLSFLMESVDHYLLYGKHLMGLRLGEDPAICLPRAPHGEPLPFSLAFLQAEAARMGRL